MKLLLLQIFENKFVLIFCNFTPHLKPIFLNNLVLSLFVYILSPNIVFIKSHSHPYGFYWDLQCSWTLIPANSMQVSKMQSDGCNRKQPGLRQGLNLISSSSFGFSFRYPMHGGCWIGSWVVLTLFYGTLFFCITLWAISLHLGDKNSVLDQSIISAANLGLFFLYRCPFNTDLIRVD